MIKSIFLDVDNTLLDFHASAALAMSDVMTDFGAAYDPAMFGTFRRINDGLWLRIEQGTLTKPELYRIRWNLIFAELGLPLDGPAFETRFLKRLQTAAVPVGGAEELLRHLQGRYLMCVTSNAPHHQQELRLTAAGLMPYLDHVFTSELVGSEKPSRSFFDGCFRRLNESRTLPIRPDEVLLIGDSPTADIRGGVDYGMRTCWFRYDADTILPQDLHPDDTVDTLTELITRL